MSRALMQRCDEETTAGATGRGRALRTAFALHLAVLWVVPLGAQSAAYRSRLLGLYDQMSGRPIADAEVFDLATGWSAKTTATGTLTLAFLPDGGSIVRIRKVGYVPLVARIAISPKDTTPLTLMMTKVTELPAVVTRDTARHFISPALNGFDERARQRITGYFITDSVLRMEENRTVGNLIRSKFPGVVLRDGPGGAAYLMASMRCGAGGPPEVYLDGVPVNVTGDKHDISFNINSVNVSDLGGVEFYPSTEELPIEFNHTTRGCGALLLWTRER